jgi:hypothetical protein
MTQDNWKTGFEAGIDFALTFANEHGGYEFTNVGELVAELKHLQKIKKIFEEHTGVKVES